MKIHRSLLWISLVLILASCTASPSGVSSTQSQPQADATKPSSSENPSGNSASPINTPDFSEITPPPADANPFVKLAKVDLANRLTISVDQIHFLKITDIDWQDITQGCNSTPGQVLKKGAVTGYRIWLEANGKNYLYHVGLDNTIFLCPD